MEAAVVIAAVACRFAAVASRPKTEKEREHSSDVKS